ncbi:MAG: DMT family transporter [bacterium]
MLYFIVTLLIFSSMEVVSKPLMGHIDPFALTFWRFVAGFVFFLFYPGMKKRFAEIAKFKKKEWISVITLGILNTFLAMSLLQVAVKNCSVAATATIFCSNPVFVMLFSNLAGLEKLSIRKGIGIVAGVGAVAFILSENGFVINAGAVFALLAAVVFAGYTVLSKKTVSKITPFTVNLTSFFAGLIANLIFMAAADITIVPSLEPFDFFKVSALIYLGFIVTGVGYVTFFETIKRLTAVSASIIFMLKPAVAILFSALFLREHLSGHFFIGLLMLTMATAVIFSDKIQILLKNALSSK